MPPLKRTTQESCVTVEIKDNADLAQYLSLILSAHYRVLTAEHGQAALDLLQENSKPPQLPHLIISDMMMPIMDGVQLLNHLKANDKYRSIPVIMLTARAAIEDKLKALRIGVDDYMTKPFEEAELLARIDNLLLHQHWRQQFQKEFEEENTTLPNKTVSITEEDAQWLKHLEDTILAKMGQFNFSVETLAHEMAASRWQLNRRIKQLTGLTAKHYLQEILLNQARHLLEQKTHATIKALTLELGIKDVRHFSRQFKQRFGRLPSDYL